MSKVRKCQEKDVPTLVSMIETTTAAQLEGMRSDRKKTTEFVKRHITSNSSLVLITDSGYLVATEQPFIWFEKRHTQILLVDADSIEVCRELIGKCIEWWNARRASLVIIYTAPIKTIADPVLLWADFENNGTMLVRRKYNGLKS